MNTSNPIDPATLDRKVLLERFNRITPVEHPHRYTTPDLITREEVANRLGVCESTITNWLNAGRLPVAIVYEGDRRRFVRASFEAWLFERDREAA